MKALNKKLSVTYQYLSGFTPPNIAILTFSVLMAASANLYGSLLEPVAALMALIFFVLSLIFFSRFGKIVALVVSVATISAYAVSGVYAVAVALLFILSFKVFSWFFEEHKSLLGLSFASHMGDAVTSYSGFLRGFSEANPFADFFVQWLGYSSIFGVKLIVLPLTLYIYLETKGSQRESYLKLIYCIGGYLTLRNILIIF